MHNEITGIALPGYLIGEATEEEIAKANARLESTASPYRLKLAPASSRSIEQRTDAKAILEPVAHV
jgi:hypothetical protein